LAKGTLNSTKITLSINVQDCDLAGLCSGDLFRTGSEGHCLVTLMLLLDPLPRPHMALSTGDIGAAY